MTVQDFIKEALEDIGVVAADRPLQPEYAIKGLKYFRRMLGAFQADPLLLSSVSGTPFALASMSQTVTIGNGGTFDTGDLRPQWIRRMGVIPAGDTVELPVVPYTRDEWAGENFKSLTELYPRRFLYEPSTPDGTLLGTITFWPIPTTAPTIRVYRADALTTLPANDDTALAVELVFDPPLVEEAWMTNLSLRLCRPFTRPRTPDLVEDARAALGALKRLNDEGPPRVRCDAAVLGTGQYDIYSNRTRTT